MQGDEYDEAELARFLAELGGEFVCRIAVHRYEPEGAAGYLGTIEVVRDGEPLLNTIRDEFGGGRLGIKFMGRGGHYLTHRTVQICAPIYKVGHRARARDNPSPVVSSPPPAAADDDARDEIASLRDEVAALAARVEDLEDQAEEHEKRQHEAEELARKAIALAEEGGEETPQERWDRFVAESREKREEKSRNNMMMLAAMAAVVVLLTKTD
jgi:hypothetical protein